MAAADAPLPTQFAILVLTHLPDHAAAIAGSPAQPNLILAEPLYDQAQAQTSLTHFRPADYEKSLVVAPGITAIFHDEGTYQASARALGVPTGTLNMSAIAS